MVLLDLFIMRDININHLLHFIIIFIFKIMAIFILNFDFKKEIIIDQVEFISYYFKIVLQVEVVNHLLDLCLIIS